MATLKQIEANRRNALKSTGPKTAEGKAAVRLNSLKHGLRAGTLFLPGENREPFDHLYAALEAEWQPESPTAAIYLEQMAIAQWKLRRLELAEASLLSQNLPAVTQIPLLDRLWQAQCRLERSFARAQRELERLQSPRPKQPSLPATELPSPRRQSPDPLPRPDRPRVKWVCSADSAAPPEAHDAGRFLMRQPSRVLPA
ncbi:MAG TPA: hypothetical protein VL285_16395 [Bryobacteraceae bacterium]|jgi:hypothetical protein|nr:hypothetical protein [Bryobacteraceae bacterium]